MTRFWFCVFCLVAAVGTETQLVDAAVIRLDKNETLFDYVPTKFRFLGKQSGVSMQKTIILDPHDYEEFCKHGKNISHKYMSHWIILPAKYVDMSCDGKFGHLTDFHYLVEWCSLVGNRFIRPGDWEPGVLANENDGNQFQELISDHPILQNCTIVDSWSTLSSFKSFMNESEAFIGVPVWLEIDTNKAMALFDSAPVFLLRVVFTLSYFGIFFWSLQITLTRVLHRKMSTILGLTLGSIQGVSCSLGILEFGGSHFTGSFWSSGAVMFFQTNLFGASVAQNFLLSALFNDIATSSFQTIGIRRDQRLFIIIAFVLLIGDLTTSLLLATSLKESMIPVAQLVLPVALILIQIMIGLYQIFQMRTVVLLLKQNASTYPGLSPQAQALQEFFLKVIMHGVRLSLFADAMSTIALAVSNYMYESRYLLLLVNAGLTCSKIASLYAQTSLCQPVPGDTLSRVSPQPKLQ